MTSRESSKTFRGMKGTHSQVPLKDNNHYPVSLGDQRYWPGKWILPVASSPVENAVMITEADRIVAIGKPGDLSQEAQAALSPLLSNVFESGLLLTPGLINAHTHLEQSLGQVIQCQNKEEDPTDAMLSWLLASKPSLQRLFNEPGELEKIISRGINELISHGVSYANDISRLGAPLPKLATAGLRARVSLEFFHPDTRQLQENLLEKTLRQYEALLGQYANHPTLCIGLSPHSPYNVSPIAWRWMYQEAQKITSRYPEHPLTFHTHLAESMGETHYLQGKAQTLIHRLHQAYLGQTFEVDQPAASPVQYLKQHGLLLPNLTAAHCVELDQADWQDLAQSQTGVVSCPRSNQYLLNKTLDATMADMAGVALAIGSDGHLSSLSLDSRAEARIARIRHGWDAEKALKSITLTAAAVLGEDHRLGHLSPNMIADIAAWLPLSCEMQTLPSEQALSPNTRLGGLWVGGERCQKI